MIVIFGMTAYFNLMKAFWKPYLSLQVCLILVLWYLPLTILVESEIKNIIQQEIMCFLNTDSFWEELELTEPISLKKIRLKYHLIY